MIVVGSSVWIDFLNGNATPEVARLSRLLGGEPLLVGDMILLEVLQGVRSETDAQRVEAALRRFDIVPMLDSELAVIAAAHYRRLRALGITVRKTIDLIIGTFCIAHGHALLTADRDFAPLARHLGLTLV
jgi:predicted nucleic acid-binding protein